MNNNVYMNSPDGYVLVLDKTQLMQILRECDGQLVINRAGVFTVDANGEPAQNLVATIRVEGSLIHHELRPPAPEPKEKANDIPTLSP